MNKTYSTKTQHDRAHFLKPKGIVLHSVTLARCIRIQDEP